MEWDKNNVSKDEYYNFLAVSQIKNDCETFKSLLPTLNQSIIVLAMMPYLALFCKETEEYLSVHNNPVKVQNSSSFSIEDTRAKLKLFNERYGKSLRYIETIDDIQDTLFKDRLRFSFLKYLNVNYNLGIYFDSKGNVISDTQFLFSMFQGKSPKAQDLIGEEVMEFGKSIGSAIASVSQARERKAYEKPHCDWITRFLRSI